MSNVDVFLAELNNNAKAYSKQVIDTRDSWGTFFYEEAEQLLSMAHASLGDSWPQTLIQGYISFVIDVNKSQLIYEKDNKYKYARFDEVKNETYKSDAFMAKYHWGVFVTTFAWGHHLRLIKFFQQQFLPYLKEEAGELVDLGAGSGVWHQMFLRHRHNWQVHSVDISPYSVDWAQRMAIGINTANKVTYQLGDALTYSRDKLFDAAISCFLAEHLEDPSQLFTNLANNLKTHGYAFVTCAITAAEIDHIFEFKSESEPIHLAQNAGFRVIATLSAAPDRVPIHSKYLPRSMALVLQKKQGVIW